MPDEQMFIRLIEWIEVWLLFSIYHISHVQWKSLEFIFYFVFFMFFFMFLILLHILNNIFSCCCSWSRKNYNLQFRSSSHNLEGTYLYSLLHKINQLEYFISFIINDSRYLISMKRRD